MLKARVGDIEGHGSAAVHATLAGMKEEEQYLIIAWACLRTPQRLKYSLVCGPEQYSQRDHAKKYFSKSSGSTITHPLSQLLLGMALALDMNPALKICRGEASEFAAPGAAYPGTLGEDSQVEPQASSPGDYTIILKID